MEKSNIEKIYERLKEESVSASLASSIINTITRLERDLSSYQERLSWLESKIDESDLEDIYVKYQKTFDLDHWSGDGN